MKRICIHTTGKDLTGSRLNRVVGTCKAGDRVEKDDNIVTAFNHTFRFLKHHIGNLDVFLRRLVESGCDHLGFHRTCHIRHLLRTLVDEEHNHIDFRMVVGDCVCY